ncbi:MAG: DUF481 domain-containing protein [Deltaproteobacteria bacterium]|nr:DUF481 domain-containing protein [Deltaproteobacteria bacterium]
MIAPLLYLRLVQVAALSCLVISSYAVAKEPRLPPFEAGGERDLAFDWVQIDSGEWLKGEITKMMEDELYFDSEEFDDVTLDWEDVRILASRGAVSMRLLDQRTLTGRIDLRDGVAYIHGATGVRELRPSEIIQIIQGTLTEKNYWSGGGSVSLSTRSGNTDQADVTLRANLTRQTVLTRWQTTYTGEITTVDDEKTANSHRVPSQFDIYLTPRFFITTPFFEWYSDEFVNIENRLTGGLGVGYEVFENSWFFWDVGLGGAYQWTGYESVLPGGDDSESDITGVATTNVDFDLPHGIEWENLYKLNLVATDFDKTSHHAESILSLDIWGPLEFELAFIFDRIEKPETDSSGDRPKSIDTRLTAGIALDF